MYGVYFYIVQLLNVVMKGETNLQNKDDTWYL